MLKPSSIPRENVVCRDRVVAACSTGNTKQVTTGDGTRPGIFVLQISTPGVRSFYDATDGSAVPYLLMPDAHTFAERNRAWVVS